jgi:DNA-binding GntR family transcriptional regulator
MRENPRKSPRFITDEVYDLLKQKLTSSEFKPGQSLSEVDIASRLRVSRTPVRHAISRLERDGLVEIIPRKGAFMKFLSMKDIVEIFQVRKALEGLAAQLAARNPDLDLAALDQFETFYLNALKENGNDCAHEVFNLGMRFHDFIISSALNQRIERILREYRVQFEISRTFFLNHKIDIQPSRAVQSIKEHLGIIEALKRRDGDLAEARLKEHITNAQKYTLSFHEIHGE